MSMSTRAGRSRVAVLLARLAGLAGIAALTACSTPVLYDLVTANVRRDCDASAPPAERAECRRKADMSYDDYERERRRAKEGS